jgi:hypothetical protein
MEYVKNYIHGATSIFVIYLKEFSISDWPVANGEIIISSERPTKYGVVTLIMQHE